MKDALSISPPRSPPSLSSAAVLWYATGRAGAAGNVGTASTGGGMKLRLTLIAKATYAWAHGGPMSPVAPEPLRTEDQTHGGLPARSVESPAETAPLLRACDVIFTGSAILPGGQRALTAAARIGLFSDRRPVLDKTVHVLADRKGKAAPEPFSRMPIVYERAFGGPGQENPVGVDAPCIVDPQDPRRAAGFGAISRFWRPRKKLVEALDRGPLEKPIQEIAEDFPWAYFQAAPADQQIGYLAGGEWLVLDGLHPELPRVQTQIPFAQAKGRVRAPNGALADVPMVADMLLLRGDTATASIVWRGTIEIPFTAQELSEVRCAVALESPGAPAMLDGLLAEPVPKGPVNVAPTAAPAAPAAAQAESTLTLAPASQAAASARSVAPFEVKAAGTGRVTADVRATPWSAAPLAKTPEAFGEGTLALGGSSAPLPPALFGSPTSSLSRGDRAAFDAVCRVRHTGDRAAFDAVCRVRHTGDRPA